MSDDRAQHQADDSRASNAGHKTRGSSHLFLVRLWTDEMGENEVTQEAVERQWQGKVQHVVSGRSGYFLDWTALVDVLLALVPADGGRPTTDDRRLTMGDA